jgi:nitroimidazol reductase NimA-like FMN-containing flavoprotein (pyridoxamine 5'-phosphate oxidase superfamily)
MKVKYYVAFEFENVDIENGQDFDIKQSILESCETMRVGFNAQDCYITDITYDGDE